MRPVLFTLGRRRFFSYPVLLYVGLVLGAAAGCVVAPSLRLRPERFLVALLIMLLPALIGSRLWFVATHWRVYRRQPRRILHRGEGGMALYGGLGLALVISLPVLGALGVDFRRFWDAATFTMLVGMVPTRLGCLLAGCCAGRACQHRLALRLPDQAGNWQRRYPVPLFEAALAIALLAATAAAVRAGTSPGGVFLLASAGYGAGRFLIEPLRAPEGLATRLPGPRLISAGLAGISLTLAMVAGL